MATAAEHLPTVKPGETEHRVLDVRAGELRAKAEPDGSLRISGLAAVFDEWTPIGDPESGHGFYERILSGAFAGAQGLGDVVLNVNHNMDTPLARAGANMTVGEVTRGLEFDATLSKTQAGRDAYTLVADGVIRGCSFAFSVAHGGDTREYSGGTEYRTIKRVGQVFDITLTPSPAYPQTTVEAREGRMTSKQIERTRLARDAKQRFKPLGGDGVPAGTTIVTPRTPYGPDSPHSWFDDMRLSKKEPGSPLWGLVSNQIPEARDRLGAFENCREQRSTSFSTLFAGINGSWPAYVADEFATAARAQAVVAMALDTLPLPPSGETVGVGTTTSGASAGVQATENTTATTADPTASLVQDPIATVAGFVAYSYQVRDRNGGLSDQYFAKELGAAFGAALELQVLNGSGSTGQMRGLLNVTGIIGVTFTAGWSGAAMASKTFDCFQQIASSIGVPPDLLIFHPRRWAVTMASSDTAAAPVTPLKLPVDPPGVLLSAAVPTTLGAGTEDAVILLNRSYVPLYLNVPDITWLQLPQTTAPSLTENLVCYTYAALGGSRRPTAIGKITGNQLAASTVTF